MKTTHPSSIPTPSFVPTLPLTSTPSTFTSSSLPGSTCRRTSSHTHLQFFRHATTTTTTTKTRSVMMTCAPSSPRRHDDKAASQPSSQILRESSPSQIAHLELGAGHFSSAIPHLEAHLADSPTDAPSWLKLCKAVRDTTGVPAALLVMRRALSAAPRNPYLWHYYAELTSKASGQDASVLQILRNALRNCVPNAALLCAAAVAEGRARNYRAAFMNFESAAATDKSDAVTYLKWAGMHQERRRYDRAREVYRAAIQHVPSNSLSVIFTAFAGMEAKGKRYDMARALYKEAAAANPHDRLVWQQWACLEEKAGDPVRARELFERAVLEDPKYTISWQSWGLLEQRQGNLDNARGLFERGTQADGSDPCCWAAWAALEATQGNVVEARRLYAEGANRILSGNNNGKNNYQGRHQHQHQDNSKGSTAALFVAWSRVDESAGDVDLSRFRLKTALKHASSRRNDKVIVLHTLAGLECRAGNHDDARKHYHEVTKLNNRDFRALYAWSMMELELFNTDKAYDLLRKCVRIAPRDVRAVQALASLECEQFSDAGGIERARKVLKNAVGWHKYATNNSTRNARTQEERGNGGTRQSTSSTPPQANGRYRQKPNPNSPMVRFWASLEQQHGDPNIAESLLEGADVHPRAHANADAPAQYRPRRDSNHGQQHRWNGNGNGNGGPSTFRTAATHSSGGVRT